jgi:signal transduction histidine kinase
MKKFNSLYWRISLSFFVILVFIAGAYVYTTMRYSEKYVQQVNQRLNRNIARDIAAFTIPLNDTGVDKKAIEDIIHSAMLINPSLEIYLLDTTGNVLAFYAPEQKIVRRKLDLRPIRQFIQTNGLQYIEGDDPRHTKGQKIFSAAPVVNKGKQVGFIYTVLASEEYEAVSGSFSNRYFWQIGLRSMIITLVVALLLGLLIIWLLTRNFRKIIQVMERFKKGDLTARVKLQATGEVKQVGDMFNEMAEILTDNIEKLKAVENLRRELIANVSHDLRTPISIIHGYMETLQMKGDQLPVEDRQRYFNIVLESTEKLQKLVSELFELSKLEANQVQPKKEPFSISELVSDISSSYRIIAKDKGIAITTDLVEDLPPVLADISLIERVMQNLLDNALKFTPSGGRIHIKTNQANHYVSVSVTDTGVGVLESDQSKIFDRYYRANDFVDLKNNTGLGLAIVKKILDLHNTTLQLQSRKNEGSNFTFQLPSLSLITN